MSFFPLSPTHAMSGYILVITSGRDGAISIWWLKLGMLFNTIQCTRQPPNQRIIQPKKSVRNPAVGINNLGLKRDG